jgi:hypothetical protein
MIDRKILPNLLQDKYESKFLNILFFLTYLFEACIEIWQNFLNFVQNLIIENIFFKTWF